MIFDGIREQSCLMFTLKISFKFLMRLFIYIFFSFSLNLFEYHNTPQFYPRRRLQRKKTMIRNFDCIPEQSLPRCTQIINIITALLSQISLTLDMICPFVKTDIAYKKKRFLFIDKTTYEGWMMIKP